MRYVRPFDPEQLSPGEASPWILAPEEEAGCAIRVRKGGGPERQALAEPFERYALVLAGEAVLRSAAGETAAAPDDLIFIPPHQVAAVLGGADTAWIEIQATAASPREAGEGGACRVVKVDPSNFTVLGGLAYQGLIDRASGSNTLRMNFANLEPNGGSPDYHIHVFTQVYLILEGEETVDIGRARFTPNGYSVVVLPPGVVHRQFNASARPVKLVTLLAPEPQAGEIWDYAVTVHNREGEVMTKAQAQAAARA